MRENFELFDFELDSSDLDEIAALDRGEDGRHRATPGHVRQGAHVIPI
jgi:2,5-diketo-D-gluconate reductase A